MRLESHTRRDRTARGSHWIDAFRNRACPRTVLVELAESPAFTAVPYTWGNKDKNPPIK